MPEKSLTEVSRDIREQYERGLNAFKRNNADYAVEILTAVLAREPALFPCREALRASQVKKAGTGGGFFKKMIGSASSSPQVAKAQLALRSNPTEAMNIAEQILNSDPVNSSAHRVIAEAAVALDFPKTAILSLKVLVRQKPGDREVIMMLGEALAKEGQVPEAERILGDLAAKNPADGELAMLLKNIAARRTMKEGGYDNLADGKGSYRDILKNKEEAVSLEQEKREVKSDDVSSRLIEENEARIGQEPNNLKLLRSTAELYVQRKEFDRANEYYQRIVAAGAVDASLERAIADLTLKKLDFAAEQLDPAAPDYQERLAQIKTERAGFQLAETQRQVERYPNDLQLRFDLGVLLFEAGKIGEAMAEFQKARNNPNRSLLAKYYLAQCFLRRGMNDLAVKQLQEAIKEKLVFDNEKMDFVYTLGCALEKMGKAEEAIEQFKQIYEIDIGYKDVAKKVDDYYSGR